MAQLRSPDARERVLVVDDEPNIRETVAINLRREGLDVVFAGDGEEAVETARELKPDLVVLDIMMPGMDGFEVCRTLREESTVPILLLSARGEEIDRIFGLELGADDFLVKPFAMRELVARVRAMLRRARMIRDREATPETATGDDPVSAANGDVIRAGDIEVDVPRREAVVNGRTLSLKPKEFDLLAYLARHPGIVLSRAALLREVWGYDFPIDTRTVDVHIRGIRMQLDGDSDVPSRISTVRGYGYRLVIHEP